MDKGFAPHRTPPLPSDPPSSGIINTGSVGHWVYHRNRMVFIIESLALLATNQEIVPREVPRIGRVLKIYVNHLPTTSIHPV